jgi:hypothetical protein
MDKKYIKKKMKVKAEPTKWKNQNI